MVAQSLSRKRPLPSASKASGKFLRKSSAPNGTSIPKDVNPQELILSSIRSYGIAAQLVASKDLDGFFFAPTEKEIMAYSQDIISAVRTQDIGLLRKFHQEGRPLKCSNKYGESILHLACRRGYLDVVKFFIKEAAVTLRVSDDYGRTPLHDACWTCNPNFELMELIIRECPDLLLLKDNRGFTPMSYARKEHWGKWTAFLISHKDILIPKILESNQYTYQNILSL